MKDRRRQDPYRLISRWYDGTIERMNAKLKDIALSMVPGRSGWRMLDVGCGTGALIERYARNGCEVWGVDLSRSMLAVARRKLGRDVGARLVLGSATQLPFEAGSFDLVTFTMMLHELSPETRGSVLREVLRVMRSGGRLMVVDFHSGPPVFPRGWLLRGMMTGIEFMAGREHFAGYRHYLATGALRPWIDELGLEREAVKVVARGNLALTVLRKPVGTTSTQ